VVYKPGLFKVNDGLNCIDTIKCLKEQNEPWGIPHTSI